MNAELLSSDKYLNSLGMNNNELVRIQTPNIICER